MSDMDMFNLDILDDDDFFMIGDETAGSAEETDGKEYSIDFKQYLKDKIKEEISQWDSADDIYAVYVGAAANNRTADLLDLPFLLEIGYGQGYDRDWRLAAKHDYAVDLIETAEERDMLVKWLESKGAENIGTESGEMYDSSMRYIGKGPGGLYETLQTIAEIFSELFDSKFISDKLGENIPVIFDAPETPWYCVEATEKANPDELAEEYLKYIRLKEKMKRERFKVSAPFAVSVAAGFAVFTPCALAAAVIDIIAGGLSLPFFGVGVIVKCIIEGLIVLSSIFSLLRMIITRSYRESESRHPVLYAVLSRIADIAAAVLILISCWFMPDRIIAAAYLVCTLVIMILYMRRNNITNSIYDEELSFAEMSESVVNDGGDDDDDDDHEYKYYDGPDIFGE